MLKNTVIIVVICLRITFAQSIGLSDNQTNTNRYLDDVSISIDSSDSGFPIIKEDFLINTFEGKSGSAQRKPVIAMDSSGNFAVAWIDSRNGRDDIYVQLYNNRDERISINTRVNDSSSGAINSVIISASDNGQYIIAWVHNGDSLYAQKFSPDGTKNGNNFVINNYYYGEIDHPSIALNNNGSFIASWYSMNDYSTWVLHMRYFNPNSSIQSNEIVLDYDAFVNIINLPENKGIASDKNENIVIVWSARSENNYKIYLQQFSAEGYYVGTNIVVSESDNSIQKKLPSVSATSDGYFLITWVTDMPYLYSDIVRGRVFNFNTQSFGEEKTYFEKAGYEIETSVTTDRMQYFYLKHAVADTYYVQKVNISGEAIGITLEYDISRLDTVNVYRRSFSNVHNNNFYILSELFTNADSEIGIEKFRTNGNNLSAITLVNDDSLSSKQEYPVAHINNVGNSIVVWQDNRKGKSALFAQVLDSLFSPIGSNISITDPDGPGININNIAVKSLSDGTFVIAFSGKKEYSSQDIILQLVNSVGELKGSNVLVENNNSYEGDKIALNVNKNDDIIICWYNPIEAKSKKYTKDLLSLSYASKIYSYDPANYKNTPVISINNKHHIFLSYERFNGITNQPDYFITSYLLDENNHLISDTIFTKGIDYTNIIFNALDDEDNFAVGWQSYYQIHVSRIYDSKYTFYNKIQTSYSHKVISADFEFNNGKGVLSFVDGDSINSFVFNDNRHSGVLKRIAQWEDTRDIYLKRPNYDIALSDDKILFAFESSRHGNNGIDIWGNIKKNEVISFDKELFYPPANDDVLYSNFPNPFNATTKIAYEILSYHHVKLAVYDILGREVKVLVNQPQEKGLYEVEFNSAGLASGIYFYRLEAFRTSVKKMIVLK